MDDRPDGLPPPETPAADAPSDPARRVRTEWPLATRWDRVRAYLHMIFVDHGFFRYAYLNLHEVAPGLYRSAQPAPHHFRRFKRLGIRTIVNLRGGVEIAAYALEREACARHGIAFEPLRLRSREAPDLATLEKVRALLERIEYPALVHCKSGADRAGLMSALALMMREGQPPETAAKALSVWYGHFRQSPTGVLDAFVDAYAADRQAAGGALDLMTWARERYNAHRLNKSFAASNWGRWLVDKVLRRE